MARSSGGGSSGGGCHSGGGGSSHHGSYHGGSHHHHHHFSHRRFTGANRYSYIDRYGNKQYVYCNHDPSIREPVPWLTFFVCLFFAANIFRSVHTRFFIPEKLPNSSSQIVIDDRQDLIQNEDSLRKTLTAFYEKTGVTPAVQTVSRNQWNKEHYSLMDYAMDEYYTLFNDEKHWLIVYSMETDPSGKLRPNEWQFEGIIGDDTDISINDWMCEKFTHQTHYNLQTMSDPGNAIGDSFARLQHQRTYRFISYNWEVISVFLLVFLCFGRPIVLGILGVIKSYKYKDAVLDE